ncbi:hypothetical protein AB9F39_37465, partial [Rhizobium leguminosarum]
DKDVMSYDLARFGPLLENHPMFPELANITLAQVTSPTSVTTRTWERGAGLALATLIVTLRPVRPVRAALTAAEKAAEPQASVS